MKQCIQGARGWTQTLDWGKETIFSPFTDVPGNGHPVKTPNNKDTKLELTPD